MFEQMYILALLRDIFRIVLFVLIGYYLGRRKTKKEIIYEDLENDNRNLTIENARLINQLNTLKESNADAE